MANFKVTVTTPGGTTITYTTVGAVAEDADEKNFTGRRAGETADGVITVYKKNIVDQKIEPA